VGGVEGVYARHGRRRRRRGRERGCGRPVGQSRPSADAHIATLQAIP